MKYVNSSEKLVLNGVEYCHGDTEQECIKQYLELSGKELVDLIDDDDIERVLGIPEKFICLMHRQEILDACDESELDELMDIVADNHDDLRDEMINLCGADGEYYLLPANR